MYLCFDVGTTSVKTALYDANGIPVAQATRDYTLSTPKPDHVEVDPTLYWRAVTDGFREILAAPDIDPADVKAVCGCSQGETIIFLDEFDENTRPAIVWLDNRARAETEELARWMTEEEFYRATGCVSIEPSWSLVKIDWVKKHEPACFAKTAKFLLVEDYIEYKLTGEFATTANLLHSTGFYDITAGRYWHRTIASLGIADRLPRIAEAGEIVGLVSPNIADDLGLSRHTAVVKGAMDQAMSAAGAGNVHSNVVTETTGTALAIAVTVGSVDEIHRHHLSYQPHILPGKYLILPYAQTSGVLYKWFRDAFCEKLIRQAGGAEPAYQTLNGLAETVPAGSEGLLLLPFFAGAGIPENDMLAKGVWYGISLNHGRSHFARSIMESVGFMLRKILSLITAAEIGIEEVRSMGGAARSDLWLQIKADICGVPIVRMRVEETSTLGCALLSAVAVGDYADLEEASRGMVRTGRRFHPRDDTKEVYDRRYEQYNELYDALAPIFRRFAG